MPVGVQRIERTERTDRIEHRAAAQRTATQHATAHFMERARLPRPSTRTRTRKEVIYRPATASDTAACALLDGTYTTTHVWQLDARQDPEELRISLRWLRLPRELSLVVPHSPPAPAGGQAQKRGRLWLVAEEVEVGGLPAESARDSELGATPKPWDHALRRSTNGPTVQLSLPAQDDRTTEAAPSRARGRIVGYVVAAAAPRERTAYLRTLVVDRSHRRKGIGVRLLAEAKRWAAQQGAECLIADAPARNFPAIRLLQRGGFAFCGYNDSCYLENEVAVFFCARLR
jgi:ribosomal protein S18 acetylase RimI-like enzyme